MAWLEDPTIGNALGKMVNEMNAAPGTALENMAKADAIAKARYQEALTRKAVSAYPAAVPEAYVAPRPFTAADIADPARLNAPIDVSERGTSMAPFTDPVALKQRQNERAAMIPIGQASIYKDPSAGPAMIGYGRVAARGPADNAQDRVLDQFYTTGKYPTETERAPNPIHNMAVTSPDGSVRVVATTDNQTEYGTGKRLFGAGGVVGPNDKVAATGPAAQTTANPIETVPIAQNNFNRAALQALMDERTGKHLTDEQALGLLQLRDAAFQRKTTLIDDPETGQKKSVTSFDVPPPTGGATGWLFDRLAAFERGDHLLPRSAAPVVTQDPAATAPPPATAAAPTPIVPQPTAAAVDPRAPVVSGAVTAGNANPIVQRYINNNVIDYIEKAKNGYSSVVSNMRYNNQASDIAIITGAAKTLDPPGVVRPVEAQQMAATQGAIDRLQGMLSKVNGGAALGVDGRLQIWNMVNEKMKADIAEAAAIREQHAVQLRQSGLDPEKYLPKLPTIVPLDRSIINTANTPEGITGDRPAVTAPRRAADDLLE